jgi:hypothetical protein
MSSREVKSCSELMGIAYQSIGFQSDLNKITFKKYKNNFPEITKEMNFIEIMKVVNRKPASI